MRARGAMASMVKRLFSEYPLVSNALVYGTLYTGAEFSQQTVSKKLKSEKELYDLASLSRYAVFGSCFAAPVLFYWYLPHTYRLCGRDEPSSYDVRAIARYGVLGVGFYPPIYYYWYKWLDSRYVGTKHTVIVKKLLMDQFLLTPPLLAAFYVCMSIMEKKDDIFEECRNKMIPTFKTSCLFWLPAQFVNFTTIPPAARVVYVGTCALVWVNILCWFKTQKY